MSIAPMTNTNKLFEAHAFIMLIIITEQIVTSFFVVVENFGKMTS